MAYIAFRENNIMHMDLANIIAEYAASPNNNKELLKRVHSDILKLFHFDVRHVDEKNICHYVPQKRKINSLLNYIERFQEWDYIACYVYTSDGDQLCHIYKEGETYNNAHLKSYVHRQNTIARMGDIKVQRLNADIRTFARNKGLSHTAPCPTGRML